MIKKNIPNFLTLTNLAAGFSAIVLIYLGDLNWVFLCLAVSLVADLLDGYTARLFKVSGPLGVQLDSLADLVSFGVMPALFVFAVMDEKFLNDTEMLLLATSCIFYVLCACWRLAKFNITESKKNDFTGLPSPASGLLMLSFGLLYLEAISWLPDPAITGILLTTILGILMISTIQFLSLKFSPGGFKANFYRYLTILSFPIPLLIMGYQGAFVSMLVYLLLSILSNFFPSKTKNHAHPTA